MDFDAQVRKVAVIGAAGKMGSGISLLMTNLLANLKLAGKSAGYKVTLIDISDEALTGLFKYLGVQLRKLAEKNINNLRTLYAARKDLIENGEIIDEFIDEALSLVRLSSDLVSAKDSNMIFEAIVEDIGIKNEIYGTLDSICSKDTFYYTNTSSIPISELEKIGSLKGRVMGVHFYNPPVVQKLIELIETKDTKKEVSACAYELGKRLYKKLVPANNVAGFIGNGHFIRDGLHAISEVKSLEGSYSAHEAIYIMNKVSQDFMIRPMGIFQLIDYVGIDVFQLILKVMNKYIKDEQLHSDLIDDYIAKGIRGGQNPDGSQKDGFLKYEKNRPVGIYNIKEGKYILFSAGDWTKRLDETLGRLPEGFYPWKHLVGDSERDLKLSNYFKNLWTEKGKGATIAKKYLFKSKEIALYLKDSGVASEVKNVNDVLINGFYHLYGPVNNYY